MRVTSLVTAGLGLTCLLAGSVPASAAPAAPAHQRLLWGPCSPQQQELNEAGAQCAKVTVPLDYSDPGGPTIRIAVSRIKADAKHGERRGILLSNPRSGWWTGP
ncbi:hypothetical protein [Streptomyces sp. NBC_00057]|uniref:hypothetical protein n=1 Tax=Streptomyces sp. NBC_00057 TaxID=2975634 RepID=UPI00386B696D